MVGLYDDPFAYDGTDFNTFLGQQDQFASGSSPEDFHVTSTPTEPHFPPAALQPLKGVPVPHHQQQQQQYHHHQQQPHQQQPYLLSPTDPLGGGHNPSLEHALPPTSHPLARAAPTSFPSSAPPPTTTAAGQPLTITTMGLPTWTTPSTTTTAAAPQQQQQQQPPQQPLPTDIHDLHALIASLQADLAQAATDRDDARMRLSTARNALYAARQVERRLRAERDEARSQADFLGGERTRAKQAEARLRRERNEARVAVMVLKDGGGHGGVKKRGVGMAGLGMGGVAGMGMGMGAESQGEESESPQGVDQG